MTLSIYIFMFLKDIVTVNMDWNTGFSPITNLHKCWLFLQILVIKMIFSRKLGRIHIFFSTCGPNMSLYGHILLLKQAKMESGQTFLRFFPFP